jgi:hypothetical protein
LYPLRHYNITSTEYFSLKSKTNAKNFYLDSVHAQALWQYLHFLQKAINLYLKHHKTVKNKEFIKIIIIKNRTFHAREKNFNKTFCRKHTARAFLASAHSGGGIYTLVGLRQDGRHNA